MTTLAATLAQLITRTPYEQLPPLALDHAAMMISSTIASAAAGQNITSAHVIRELAKEQGGVPEASIWFSQGAKMPAVTACRANAVLVETAGSIGAAMHAGPGKAVVGLDISCTHHRSATDGRVTAVATPLSLGRTVTSYEVRVTDDQGRALCTGRLTCLIRDVPGA
mgnify:CR=1 FL=1